MPLIIGNQNLVHSNNFNNPIQNKIRFKPPNYIEPWTQRQSPQNNPYQVDNKNRNQNDVFRIPVTNNRTN